MYEKWLYACLFAAGVANAQTPLPDVTAHGAKIVIADGACNALANLVVIVNDRDRFEYPVFQQDGKRMIDTATFGFAAENASASLRSPDFRSDCVKGEIDGEEVVFTFTRCNTDPVSDVTIRMEKQKKPIPVSYVRNLPARQPGTVPCREGAWFDTVGSVKSVRFGDEELILQIGSNKPDPGAHGGLKIHEVLNLIPELKKGFSPALTLPWLSRDEALNPDSVLRESDFISLSSDTQAYVLAVQHAKGDGSAPHLSSVSIDLAIGRMKEHGTLHLKVETRGLKK